jgi:catechol 2,3-dioxygenase-like lactoylglutathione lyase family enzyme
MALGAGDVFAGIAVSDYTTAIEWYQRLFGCEPTFLASETEAVWELAEHRWVYIEQRPERAGGAMVTSFVDDLDAVMEQIADRGIEPDDVGSYPNDIRKAIYHDADGNEICFGGGGR